MEYVQQEMVKVLDRAAEFAKQYATELGAVPTLERLAEVRRELLGTGTEQFGAAKASLAGTVTKGELRERLRANHLVPISRIALTRREDIPVLKLEKFRVPPLAASDVTLLTAAGAMAAVAEEYWALLRADLGEAFLDELRAATSAFHDSIIARDNHRFQRGRATTSADLRMKKARQVVAVLTSVVEKRLVGRPEVVAEWRRRVRIPRKPGVPRGTVRPASAEAPNQQPAGTAAGGVLKVA